jgi:hypothetical protein
VAGIISLLNDFLISEGKDPLGFLNPWLYGLSQYQGLKGLNDIMWGSDPGCNTDGFPAAGGWDPVRPARVAFLFLGLPDSRFLGHGSRVAGLFRSTKNITCGSESPSKQWSKTTPEY